MAKFLHPLLRINPREVGFDRRGFTCLRSEIRERLEHVGRVFLEGYHAALEQDRQEELATRLNQIQAEYKGFAFEGAAMALALLDGLGLSASWKRLSGFAAGSGKQHIYMVYVGAGWAIARLPWLRRRIESVVGSFHPVLGWLAVDGYGFHEGYFHGWTGLESKTGRLAEKARHVFYQGLGRSLWFSHGANLFAIKQTISSFPAILHSDAWSGVGLGCAYAGGLAREDLDELRWSAGPHSAALAQGAAFAAGARQLAGNPVPHTELACAVLCGMSIKSAADLCDRTLRQAASMNSCSFQRWRALVQDSLSMRGDSEPAGGNRAWHAMKVM